MNRAVRHLRTIGYQASGSISDEELVKAPVTPAQMPPNGAQARKVPADVLSEGSN